MSNQNRALPPIFILAASVLWGTTGTSQAFAPVEATPIMLGTVRMIIGGLSMLLLAVSTGAFKRKGQWAAKNLFLSVAALAAFNPLFFTGLAKTGVAVGTVVAIGSAPIFAGILGWLLKREKPSNAWTVATMLAIAGCSLLFFRRGDIHTDTLGILFSLGAGFSYSSYTIFSKKLLENHHPYAVVSVVFLVSAVVLIPWSIGQDYSWIWSVRGSLVSLHLGLITAALAYVLFSKGLLNTPAPTAVSLTLAEPLTAATLGVLLLKETLDGFALMGICLLVIGLIILMKYSTWDAKNEIEYVDV